MAAHQWEEAFRAPILSRHRRCVRCGLVQQFSSGSRRIGGHPGGWYPPAKKCGLVNLQLKRIEAGRYITQDGLFRVWQSTDFERRWYVNHANESDDVETLYFGGFRTKELAVEWLAMNALDYLPEKSGTDQ